MKEIEKLAIGLFQKHSLRADGRTYDWNYLSRERQIEWMKESLLNLTYAVSELEGKLKVPPPPNPNESSYWMGFKQGLHAKHIEYITELRLLVTTLANQLAEITLDHYDSKKIREQ